MIIVGKESKGNYSKLYMKKIDNIKKFDQYTPIVIINKNCRGTE